MKNWNTTTPPLSNTGKSKLLLCRVQWGRDIYPTLAFYNGTEWVERNADKVVGKVTGWQEFYL